MRPLWLEALECVAIILGALFLCWVGPWGIEQVPHYLGR